MFGLRSTNQSFAQELMVKRSLLRVSAASCGVSIDIETSVVCKQADRAFGAINYDIDMNKKTK